MNSRGRFTIPMRFGIGRSESDTDNVFKMILRASGAMIVKKSALIDLYGGLR